MKILMNKFDTANVVKLELKSRLRKAAMFNFHNFVQARQIALIPRELTVNNSTHFSGVRQRVPILLPAAVMTSFNRLTVPVQVTTRYLVPADNASLSTTPKVFLHSSRLTSIVIQTRKHLKAIWRCIIVNLKHVKII